MLTRHLRELSLACSIVASRDLSVVIIQDVKLSPGWNRSQTQMLVQIPEDYPLSPPGTAGSYIYVEAGLRFGGRRPADYTEGHRFAGIKWAWWCYENIGWDPLRDNLVTLLERVRADLSNPEF